MGLPKYLSCLSLVCLICRLFLPFGLNSLLLGHYVRLEWISSSLLSLASWEWHGLQYLWPSDMKSLNSYFYYFILRSVEVATRFNSTCKGIRKLCLIFFCYLCFSSRAVSQAVRPLHECSPSFCSQVPVTVKPLPWLSTNRSSVAGKQVHIHTFFLLQLCSDPFLFKLSL